MNRGQIENRFDPHANHPKFQIVFKRLKKYKVVQLKEVSKCIFSGITPKAGGDAYSYDDNGIYFIKSGSLSTDGILTIDITSKIKPEIHNGIMKSSKIEKNDVLIAIVGATIGKIGLFDSDCEANINQAIAAVRLKDNILPEFLVAYMLSPYGQAYLEYLKRPVARANINLQEIGKIEIPLLSFDEQKKIVESFCSARSRKNEKVQCAKKLIQISKNKFLGKFDFSFKEYKPSLYSYNRLKNIQDLGIYCNPHSDYLNSVFNCLMENNYYAGCLEDFVEINPITSKKELSDDSIVSFVPMTAVEEKNNEVVYETKPYNEVKTGFTCFKKGDLLWAKITPCMQNGKSFIALDMPTDIGFGSTEFHVLRQKSDRIYMPYLWVVLSNEHILEAAQGMFSGSAGQQRVPDTFLKKLPIVLPPVEMQKESANEVFEALKESKRLRREAEQEWHQAKRQFERELLGE